MGSATTQALAATRAALDSASGVDLSVARELFAAAHTLGASHALSGALADWAATPEARSGVVTRVFGPVLGVPAVSLLSAAAVQRWSTPAEFVDGVEELAVRTAAAASTEDVEAELFGFSRTIAANQELELALGSRVGDSAARGELVASLLTGRASDATTLIASSLVAQPRGRRVRALLTRAMRLVSDQRGRLLATVYAVSPLSDAQEKRLAAALASRYDGDVTLNVVVDPSVVGGLRVQIGDDVIDASVSARLADLRARLAG